MLTDELTFPFIFCENIIFENSFDKIIYFNFSRQSALHSEVQHPPPPHTTHKLNTNYYSSDFKSESFRTNLSGYPIIVAQDIFVLIVFMKRGDGKISSSFEYFLCTHILIFSFALFHFNVKSIYVQSSDRERLVFQALGVPVRRLVQAADSASV